jgi:hypothetical protein
MASTVSSSPQELPPQPKRADNETDVELATRSFYNDIVARTRSKELSLEVGAKIISSHALAMSNSGATRSHGRILNVASQAFSQLVPLANQAHDEGVLLQLAEEGACMRGLPEAVQRKLAKRAVNEYRDKALAQFVRDGASLEVARGSCPLLLQAASSGLSEGVKAMLERNIGLQTRDDKGNTLLHLAVFLGNTEMVRTVSLYIDPRIPNAAGDTPFQALLKAQERGNGLVQIPELRYSEFLQSVLGRPHGPNEATSSPAIEQVLQRLHKEAFSPLPGDLVEIAFLLNFDPLTDEVLAHVSSEEFRTSCKGMLAKYPKKAVEEFASCHFRLEPGHYADGCSSFDIPTAPPNSNPSLERLHTLFDSLKGIDPVNFLRAAREEGAIPAQPGVALALLKSDLDLMVRRISRREHFTGVPQDPEKRKKFFNDLECMLKYIIVALEEQKNAEVTAESMQELIAASTHCGMRYYTAILNTYLEVCCHAPVETSQQALLKAVAHIRLACLKKAVSRLPQNEAHDHYDAGHNLGVKLGIPGYKQMADVDDPYSRLNRNDQFVEREFFKEYTPHKLIQELLALMEQDGALRDHYLELHKLYGGPLWKQNFYRTVREQLTEIEQCTDAEEKEILLMTLLEHNRIMPRPRQSPADATIEDQTSDYLSSVVYNEGHLRPEGVAFVLTRLGILGSSLGKVEREYFPVVDPAAEISVE